jgi:hypothetical protein
MMPAAGFSTSPEAPEPSEVPDVMRRKLPSVQRCSWLHRTDSYLPYKPDHCSVQGAQLERWSHHDNQS